MAPVGGRHSRQARRHRPCWAQQYTVCVDVRGRERRTASGRRREHGLGATRWSASLVPNSCEVTTSPISPISLGTPPPRRWDTAHRRVWHCMQTSAGSVYSLAAYILCFRGVRAITSQLPPQSFSAFLYRTRSLPWSFHLASWSADRLMLRITLPEIQWMSWPAPADMRDM